MKDQTTTVTIINATFPRSGHRCLKSFLAKYFQDSFVYWESHDGRVEVGERVAVPARKHPDIPVVYPESFQPIYVKTHDFAFEGSAILAEDIPDKRRYLVQFRHPLESIVSHYEYGLKVCGMMDSAETWANFIQVELGNWKRFIQTWVFSDIHPRLLVPYQELTDTPVETTAKVIAFMTDDSDVDMDRVAQCVAEHNSAGIQELRDRPSSMKAKLRDIRDFKYFSQKSFRRLEASIRTEYLEPLGLSPIMSKKNWLDFLRR